MCSSRRRRARPARASAAPAVAAPETSGRPSSAEPTAPDARSHSTEVVVIGAGLGGLCCAALLAKYGVQVHLACFALYAFSEIPF